MVVGVSGNNGVTVLNHAEVVRKIEKGTVTLLRHLLGAEIVLALQWLDKDVILKHVQVRYFFT